jgi:NTP pyrophosphatase (non-canonical NTP hydrolase)
MDLKALTKKTMQVNKQFKNWKSWDTKTRFVDLIEEIGELANAILTKEKAKGSKPGRQKEGFKDSLCDCLYDILILAAEHNVDLEKEYLTMLSDLKKRIKSGEFD